MKLLLELWALSHLLLSSSSSSSACGNQQPWASADDTTHKQTQDLEAPWLVSIIGNGQRCQGAVLNNWWILTAANCFLLMKPNYVELIMAGGHSSTITASQFLSHRGFSSWARPPNNDLGLVLLGQPIDLRRREMWPVCIPDGKESSPTWEQCKIYKRDQDGSKQWLERTAVHILAMSKCTTQWPGTTEQWNLCMARQTHNKTDCRVLVGSPVLCHDQTSDHWELRGIVSQGLTNCTSPVLASQVVPHLEWLWQERILKNPIPSTPPYTETTRSTIPSLATERSSKIAPQLPDVFPKQEELAAQPPVASLTEQPFETAIYTETSRSIIPSLANEQSSKIAPRILDTFPTQEELAPQQLVVSLTEEPFETASLRTPKTTSQPSPMDLPVIFPFAGQIFGVPPRAAQVKQSQSQVVKHTTAGHSVSVKSSTVQQSPPATQQPKHSSPGTSAVTKSPVTPSRRKSHPRISTLRAAKFIITAHSTVVKSPATSGTFTSASAEAHFITNKQSSVIPSKKHLPPKTRKPPPEKPATSGESSTTKQSPLTPTTSHSALAELTVVHSHHVIIIPATVRPSLTSPASKNVPSAYPPSLKLLAQMSAAAPFIAAGPHFPKNKFQQTLTSGPPLTFLTSRNTAVSTAPILVPHTHMTMEQCEMALAWNSVSRTYQLNKMADLMDLKIGCGLRPGFVPQCLGCSEAEVGEFPWVVSLTLSIQHFCAGSILNPWWILTTAKCASLIKDLEALVLVRAGLVDTSEGTGSVPIRQALTYPNSLASQDRHNLGLLQLQKPLEFGPHVAPVCLSDAAHVIEDFRNCWLPSWTVLQGGPARLLRRPLTILSISSCSHLEEKLSKAIFCIKAQKDQKGICKGDPGSPLICPDPKGGAWVQLGVLSSFDEACSRPYVFNSLHQYLPWLEETTKAGSLLDNYTVSWHRQGNALQLRARQEPAALVKWISAHSSLPWQVLVASCGNRSCGGSILDRYWVLTTAQCVQKTNPANIAVFVGLTHPKGHAQGILVAGIYPYEGILRSNLSAGNVALLLLQDPVVLGKYATTIVLPLMDTWDSCKVMGLQTLKPGKAEPDPLAYQAKVLLASDCAKKHPGINPSVYCVVRNSAHYLPVATVLEGAALLCHLQAKSIPWSQVGLTNEPFPGSQPDVLSSSIVPYMEWIEATSKEAKHLLLLSCGRTAHWPSWALLPILPLFGVTAFG